MPYTIGIDVGSTAIKVVFTQGTQIDWCDVAPTKPGQQQIVEALIDRGCSALGIGRSQIAKTCASGYGRRLIKGSDTIVDELSANARGAHLLSNGQAELLINIGGQDVKVIKLNNTGGFTDFKMNDKCAAGTGRFFEIAATILDTPLSEFSSLSQAATNTISLNSTCVVFAESEMISLLAEDTPKGDIIKGLHDAVAKRIANMINDTDLNRTLYLDGGGALNQGLLDSFQEHLMCDVYTLPQPQFTVAWGACFF